MKLSPNQTDIAESARRTIDAGADGLAVTNTFMGMARHSRASLSLVAQRRTVWPAVKPMSLLKVLVYQVAKHHGVPIIGQAVFVAPKTRSSSSSPGQPRWRWHRFVL